LKARVVQFGYALDLKLAREKAYRILSLMEAHLAKSQWLALDRPTIADIACMPYVAISHEGGVPLTRRIQQLSPGWSV
jgi:glutathione S-transferase